MYYSADMYERINKFITVQLEQAYVCAIFATQLRTVDENVVYNRTLYI